MYVFALYMNVRTVQYQVQYKRLYGTIYNINIKNKTGVIIFLKKEKKTYVQKNKNS